MSDLLAKIINWTTFVVKISLINIRVNLRLIFVYENKEKGFLWTNKKSSNWKMDLLVFLLRVLTNFIYLLTSQGC